MTSTNLDALIEKAMAATPGPWHATHLDRFEESRVVDHVGNTLALCDGRVFLGQHGRADYIASLSPEVVIALCEVAKAAETVDTDDMYDARHWLALQSALAHLDDVMEEK